MKKIFLFACILLTTTQFFVSCKKSDTKTYIAIPVVLPANGSSVIEANNKFGFEFLKATLQLDTTPANKLISPLSIYLALSMVYNGADNATKDSIANALQLSGLNIDSLNAVCKSLIEQLPGEDNEVQFSIANSIWYNKTGYQPLPAFLNVVNDFYDASINPLDFTNPSAVDLVNNWAAQHTNNKIPKIIDKISAADLMYLINAIYFNGAWKNAFDPAKTRNYDFQLQNRATVSVPFMDGHIKVNRYRDTSMDVIELPYGTGKNYGMYLALPKNLQQPITQFASLMNPIALKNAISKMDSAQLEVLLPTWEYAYSIDNMQPELSALGMSIAFGEKADFSKLYSSVGGSISKAIHKTYIKVNETGTEAAAVTAIGVTTTAMQLPAIIVFDHPFLYTIVEKQTGAVLFIGIVNNPSIH